MLGGVSYIIQHSITHLCTYARALKIKLGYIKTLIIFDPYKHKELMIIDVTPVIEAANDFDRTCIDMREIDALYVVRLANGKDFSVKWDLKELKTFLPKRTVSEMLKIWEEGLHRNLEIAKNSVETGLHPTWTTKSEIMRTIGDMNFGTGKFEEVPKPLTNSQTVYFKFKIVKLEAELGKMVFVKLV
jgi:hypothetical protein